MTKRPIESDEEFIKLIGQWQVLEDKTIASAVELIGKTNNPLVRTVMEMIKHDSGKHKIMLQMILDNLTKEAAHLSPDELASLSLLLSKHMEVEAESITLANSALKRSELAVTRHILSALLADETKHHSQLHELNEELKRSTIFVT